MILRTVRIRDFKSISDTGEVPIDQSITCLVGKNESGKTAFLEALYRLNPVETGHPARFDPLRDFPRSRYARERDSIGALNPISAKFELEPDELSAVEAAVGPGVLPERFVTVTRNYENRLTWQFNRNEAAAVQHLIAHHGVDPAGVGNPQSVAALQAATTGVAEPSPAIAGLAQAASSFDLGSAILNVIQRLLPRFYYFDDYSELPGRVSIPRLQNTPEAELDPGNRTALALLRLAGAESGEFTEANYEARRASLEAASSEITQEVFEYWSQNARNLRVLFDADFHSPAVPPDDPPFLEIRIENLRHFITLNFSERSAGFQWFFSFLAAFSEFRGTSDLVLLLDEPALGLHATAQSDLLRYIEERLAPDHVVLYSTHSPFMVDPHRIDRVRTVEDRDNEGTVVSADVLGTSRETVFPLQAALGYELAQTLFVGPNVLLVEGPADFIYLTVISDFLTTQNRGGLDAQWMITPVGGLDKIPTFIALLKTQLNIAVVLDEAAGGSQKINSMIQRGIIAANNVISLASIRGTSEADIEDLFKDTFYLKLVRESGAATVNKADLPAGDRIIARIEKFLGHRFNHYIPARHLLTHQSTLLAQIDSDTLDRFEALFNRVNPLVAD